MSLQDSHQIGNVKIMLAKGIDGEGITSIEKTGSSGLVDTYTITYTSGMKSTFTVTNGKSIDDIEKTGTSGLIDTYTIYYNDGTTSTFEVVNGGYDVGDQHTMTGEIVTFSTNSSQVAQDTKLTFTFTQDGSGDPSPDNVRDIHGFNDVIFRTTNKNIWNNGDISGTRQTDMIPFYLPAGTYTFSAVATSSDTDASVCKVNFHDDPASSAFASASINRGTRSSAQFTLSKPCLYVRFLASDSSAHSSGDTFSYVNIQIEMGSTETAYQAPDNGLTTYKWDFNAQEPYDTVYSGTLDIQSGILTVDKVGVDASTLTWSYSSRWLADTKYLPKYYANNEFADMSAEKYKVYDANGVYGHVLENIIAIGVSQKIAVYNGSTVETPTGLIVYPLETPLVFQLRPYTVEIPEGTAIALTNATSMSLKYRDGYVDTLEDIKGVSETVESLSNIVETKVGFRDLAVIEPDGTKTYGDMLSEMNDLFLTKQYPASQILLFDTDFDEIAEVYTYVGRIPADVYSLSYIAEDASTLVSKTLSPTNGFAYQLELDISTNTSTLTDLSSEVCDYRIILRNLSEDN